MNRENLTRLRDHLETLPPEQFDMTQWHCGTAACIAGHAASLDPALWPKIEAILAEALPTGHTSVLVQGLVQSGAMEWLGLNHETANVLFCPEDEGGDMEHADITLTEAVGSIDALLSGGLPMLRQFWGIHDSRWDDE